MCLQAVWTNAPRGRMPLIEQAKLWALREVFKEMGEAADEYLRMSRLVITAGGRNPDRKVVAKLFARVIFQVTLTCPARFY